MALFNNFPYTDLNSINLDYTLNKLNDLYTQGETLYSQLAAWKDQTDADLETFRTGLLADVAQWESDLNAALATWKDGVDADVVQQLNAAKAELLAYSQTVLAGAEAAQTAAEAAQTAAETAETNAEAAQTAAEAAATSVAASAAQITANAADITDLKSAMNDIYANRSYNDAFIDGSYINTSYSGGDTLNPNSTTNNSTYTHIIIPVVSGHTYTFTATTESGTGKRAYVRTDSNYVVKDLGGNGVSFTNKTITPPYDGYLIVNAKKASTHSLTEYYYPLDSRVTSLETDVEDLSEISSYFRESSNILNPANATDNLVISSSGSETTNSDYATSDYIPVESATSYTVKASGYLAEYSSNTSDSFIKRLTISYSSSGQTVTTNSSTTYVRLCTKKSTITLQNARICLGTTLVDENYFEVGLDGDVELTSQLDGVNEDIDEINDTLKTLVPTYGVPFMPSLPYHYTGSAIDANSYKEAGHLADIYGLYDALVSDAQYSQYISRQTIGRDASDTYDIKAYTIDNGTNYAYRLPRIVWISSIHGNEANTTISTYYMVKELLDNFVSNSVCYGIMSAVRLYVIPVMNPWGVENYSRLNANHVNLNRNFPADWLYRDPSLAYGETKYGIESASNGSNMYYYYGGGTCVYDDENQTATTTYVAEAETQAVMDFIDSINTGTSLRGTICFAVNKHDAGYMSAEGATILMRDNFSADREFLTNLTDWFKAHLMGTQNWLTEKSGLNMATVSYSSASDIDAAGTMDKWFNAKGLHGCLLEIPKAAGTSYTDQDHASDLCTINVDFGLTLMSNVIVNNAKLKDNTQTATYTIVT